MTDMTPVDPEVEALLRVQRAREAASRPADGQRGEWALVDLDQAEAHLAKVREYLAQRPEQEQAQPEAEPEPYQRPPSWLTLALADPGKYVPRRFDIGPEQDELEPLTWWQARAVLVAQVAQGAALLTGAP